MTDNTSSFLYSHGFTTSGSNSYTNGYVVITIYPTDRHFHMHTPEGTTLYKHLDELPTVLKHYIAILKARLAYLETQTASLKEQIGKLTNGYNTPRYTEY